MDIPAEIPVSYQPIWEDGYNQAIGEGIVEAVEHAWDELERYLFEGAVGKAAKEIRKAGGKTHVAFQGGMTDKDNPDEGETESRLWRPVAKYNGSNWEIVKKDMNKHRVTMIENSMSAGEVLKMYGITHSKPDYDKIYAWLEKGLIRLKHWLKNQNNEPV